MSKLNALLEKLCPDGVEYVALKDCTEMKRGTSATKKSLAVGDIPVISGGREPSFYCDTYNREGETITVAGSGAGAGYLQYWNEPIFVNDAFSIKALEHSNTRYLYHCLLNMQEEIYNTKKGAGVPHVHISSIHHFQIPLPPLEVQGEIVRMLDNFTELTAELTARKKQYEYYRDHLLTFGDDVPRVALGEIIHSLKTGLNPRKNFSLNTDGATNYYVTVREIIDGKIVFLDKTDRVDDEALVLIQKRSDLDAGDVLFSGTGTIGRTAIIKEKPENWGIKEGVYVIKPKKDYILPQYLEHILNSGDTVRCYKRKIVGSPVASLPMAELKKLPIPLPSLQEQARIVEILDKFDALTTNISEGLPAEIKARQAQYEYYRDKLLTFPQKEASN